jgi:hypothetical protein
MPRDTAERFAQSLMVAACGGAPASPSAAPATLSVRAVEQTSTDPTEAPSRTPSATDDASDRCTLLFPRDCYRVESDGDGCPDPASPEIEFAAGSAVLPEARAGDTVLSARVCQGTLASLAGLTAMLAAGIAHAEPDECDRLPNALVADLGLHVVSLGFQRTLGCAVVMQASFGIYRPWTVNLDVLGMGDDGPEDGDVSGWVLRSRPFVFPLGQAPTGFWLSPFGQLGPASATRDGKDVSGATYAAGLSAGYTFALGERFLLALGAGAQYHVARLDGSTAFPGYSRVAPTGDLNLDYRF